MEGLLCYSEEMKTGEYAEGEIMVIGSERSLRMLLWALSPGFCSIFRSLDVSKGERKTKYNL